MNRVDSHVLDLEPPVLKKQKEWNERLLTAINKNDLEEFRTILNKVADYNGTSNDENVTCFKTVLASSIHASVAGIRDHNEKVRKTMINELLTIAKRKNVFDCLNEIKENQSVFHVAAKDGRKDILKTLLEFDEDTTKRMINRLTTADSEGFTPIHFAVSNNHLACVRVLIDKNADVCVKTTNYKHSDGSTTPLHIAIGKDHYEIAEFLCKHKVAIEEFDGKGWTPLHFAIHKGSEKYIKLLLKHNASLAKKTEKSDEPKTALDIIMKHVTNPTEFLEDILNSYISYNDSTSTNVKVDYSILMPSKGLKNEMAVIMALLKTGNEFNQKRLLLHSLIKSYIYLRWWASSRYYFVITAIYLMFVISVASFATTFYHNKDTTAKTEFAYSLSWGCVIVFFNVLLMFQELLMNFEDNRYFLEPESWIKLGSLILAFIMTPAIMAEEREKAEWPRHVSTVTLLLACIQMLNIISQIPRLGYYVVMFKKVAFNIFKIMATFSILIIGFALSFMIEFRSQIPFDGLWHAVVKTLFLLTAEFEYNNVFEAKNAETLGSSFTAVRVLFIAFLFLAAIVLMNMMVGVAVDDIAYLKSHGNIGRLEKQATFVHSVDRFRNNHCKVNYPVDLFSVEIVVERKTGKTFKNIQEFFGKECQKVFETPKRLKDALFSIAKKNKEKEHTQKTKEKELKEENNKTQFYKTTMKTLDMIQDVKRELELLRTDFLEIKHFLLRK